MLVLDINMPGRSGMDVLRDVKHTYPRLPVIILSCQPEDQYAVRCLRLAQPPISTKRAPRRNCASDKKDIERGRYIGDSLAEKLAANLDEPWTSPCTNCFPTGTRSHEDDRLRHSP